MVPELLAIIIVISKRIDLLLPTTEGIEIVKHFILIGYLLVYFITILTVKIVCVTKDQITYFEMKLLLIFI